VAGGLTALDQVLERPLDRIEIGEVVQALAPLLQLAGSLRSAQHQYREQGDLWVVEAKGLIEQVAVLAGAAAGTAGEPRPAA
jgi:hypothetical protein